MSDSYPFRGTARWLILPALLTVGGVMNGVAAWALQSGDRSWWWMGAILCGANAFGVGLALAVGRRAVAALPAAFILGALSLSVAQELMRRVSGMAITVETSCGSLAVVGAWTSLAALTHLLYVRARRLGWAGIAGGVAIYVLSAAAGAWAMGLGASDIAKSGAREGLLRWLAFASAIWVSERAAPAPTPPAPNA